MLQFDQLSFWEKSVITEDIDFIVVGGGIVGAATAIRLREMNRNAKIVLLERGYLSTGASTKNAGFACFGSLTEIADDLTTMDATTVWDTVAMRWRGLQRLQERFDPKEIDFQVSGSWDLLNSDAFQSKGLYDDHVNDFNHEIAKITGQSNCFSWDNEIQNSAGFQGIYGGYHNRLEGEIHTGKLLLATNARMADYQIITLYGVEVLGLETMGEKVVINTNFGELKTNKVAVTVNGFAQKLLSDNRIQPARAQVVVTEPIPDLKFKGTYHYDKGYYYFRNVGNRLLIGGGRNLNFEGETTTSLENTKQITDAIYQLIDTTILPGKQVKIDYQWAGIMGVGNEKKPIIELIAPNVGIGVRMGGMGVAIGSLVGEELAELMS